MSNSKLGPGCHLYEDVIQKWSNGALEFAVVDTLSGDRVPLIGLSPEQLSELQDEVKKFKLGVVLYGSRVTGPRTHQRTLHPVLKEATPTVATKRHASATLPSVSGVHIRKDSIKEFGYSDPQTSDLSIAALGVDINIARVFESAINEKLDVEFPIRVHRCLHGSSFNTLGEFLEFWRNKYIKNDLPAGHLFTDADIDQATRLLLVPMGNCA